MPSKAKIQNEGHPETVELPRMIAATVGLDDTEISDPPLLVAMGDAQVLFGPGTGRFNEFDDPC